MGEIKAPELKPCPFCGGQLVKNARFSTRLETVYTSACEPWCLGGAFFVGDNQLERWNRRSGIDRPTSDQVLRDRDKLWCRAAIETLSVDDVERLTSRFNQLRED